MHAHGVTVGFFAGRKHRCMALERLFISAGIMAVTDKHFQRIRRAC
jgi:hypothetical protein